MHIVVLPSFLGPCSCFASCFPLLQRNARSVKAKAGSAWARIGGEQQEPPAEEEESLKEEEPVAAKPTEAAAPAPVAKPAEAEAVAAPVPAPAEAAEAPAAAPAAAGAATGAAARKAGPEEEEEVKPVVAGECQSVDVFVCVVERAPVCLIRMDPSDRCEVGKWCVAHLTDTDRHMCTNTHSVGPQVQIREQKEEEEACGAAGRVMT